MYSRVNVDRCSHGIGTISTVITMPRRRRRYVGGIGSAADPEFWQMIGDALMDLEDALYDLQDVIPPSMGGRTPRTQREMPSRRSRRPGTIPLPTQTKAKRRVSSYQRQFGINLKKLKKKHPRTPLSKLMKKAHTMTKREMKK